ncbi:DUF6274 family protein [Streptomyces crystallinus]|uniref:Uncharacterized protein n=1 Tax=Streptomyces crystallinus TaxID=68191 RepID=A0ABN1GZK7_9ACTN
MTASSAKHETRALLRAHLSAASGYRHVTRHCPVCSRLLRLAMDPSEPDPLLAVPEPPETLPEAPCEALPERLSERLPERPPGVPSLPGPRPEDEGPVER